MSIPSPGDSLSDLIEAERAQLVRVMEYAPSLIYVFNQLDQANEYSNRNLGEMLGYSPQEVKQMGAELMPTLIHPEDLPKVFEHFSKIQLLQADHVASLEYRVKHKLGHWVWLLSRDTVFRRSADGDVTHHIGAAVDISAQKEAEASLQASETKAQSTNQELRDFAYAVSHDMKAPSNTLKLILTEMEVSLSEGDLEDTKELVATAQATINDMQHLIDDVLSHTRVVGQEMTHEVVDLAQVLQTVMSFLKADIVQSQARIEISDLPLVWGSQNQLLILFQNLLQNSLKFSRENVAPVIKVDARIDEDNERVSVCVSDNGIGIPLTRQQQIFKLFKKLNGAEQFTGSGIGLATCRRIALNHKTEISLSSEPDQGANFSIELTMA